MDITWYLGMESAELWMKKIGVQLMVVKQNKNNLFPVEFTQPEQLNVVISSEESSRLWHERYGHLNFQSLQVLN